MVHVIFYAQLFLGSALGFHLGLKDFSRGAMSLIMFMRIWIIYFSLLQISFVGLKKLFVQKQFGLEKTLGLKKCWSQKSLG